MKIAIIHSALSGFFPRFYQGLTQSIENNGDEFALFVPNIKTNRNANLQNKHIFGTRLNTFLHQKLCRLTGLQDVYSYCATRNLIRQLRHYRPDVIHAHIVNDKYLNLPLFVRYLNQNRVPLVWTMHDCRAFTGRCAYFDEISCDKWKVGCIACPQKHLYEPTLIDNSHIEWNLRKKYLTKIKYLTIVTPSQWLASLVQESFLSKYPCLVIHNGIDTQIFKKRNAALRKRYGLEDKKVILGLAWAWEERKGLKTFLRLNEDLPLDYKVVLVGHLPSDVANILTIPPTNNLSETAALYQMADVFVNPTLADNFPTTNIESLASGTPVITYQTGGSPEALDDRCGIVVPKNDYNALKDAIISVVEHPQTYSQINCLKRAQEFTLRQFDLYVKLYHSVAIVAK